jgi:BirA family transcriptional regulator, biotin operon repressor / biotin---[acetyl-CoA-carboxylase] ligase
VAQSPYSDLARPPLDGTALRRALLVPGGLWTDLVLHRTTASTNADAALAAYGGAPEGLVIVAEQQTAGRGRLDRRWESPARAGLAVSVLLRPEKVPANRYGWLPLLAGVALAEAVRGITGLDASLKWPNDLLVDRRKCGGILAELVPAGVVVGIGLNVTLRADELPARDATSLELAGAAVTDRDPLLRALLRGLARWYERWRDAEGNPDSSGLRGAYLDHCATLGQGIRVALPDGSDLVGEATTIDDDGRLVVTPEGGPERHVAAGDVVYVRR